MQVSNLLEKDSIKTCRRDCERYAKKHALNTARKGEIVQFWAGYSDDIRMQTEVIGTDGGDIHLLWDCWWFPIRDEKRRDIKRVLHQTGVNNGFCRVYYRSGSNKRLLCMQDGGRGKFALLECTKDGEPSHELDQSRYVIPAPSGESSTERALRKYLEKGVK